MMHLQAVRKTLCNHHQNMVTLLTMDLSEISIVEKEERCLVTVEIDRNVTFEKEVELITSKTARYQPGRLHIQPKGKYLRAFHKGEWDKLSFLPL